CVGIAEERPLGDLAATRTGAPANRPCDVELALQRREPLVEPLLRELRVGVAALTTATTTLAVVVGRGFARACGFVPQARHLDLQLGFSRAGALFEHPEDRAGAVEDVHAERRREAPLLGRGQLG